MGRQSRFILISIALMMAFAWVPVPAQTPSALSSSPCFSLPPVEQMMVHLDSVPLSAVEGIWEYPGDETIVTILRSGIPSEGRFAITVLESTDPRLKPGDTLGWLKESYDPDLFELTQYSRRKKSILDLPGSCTARLRNNSTSLLIDPPRKLSIAINPLTILPRFWRILRVNAKNNRSSTPAEGLRKLYPSAEGQGILHRPKRYL